VYGSISESASPHVERIKIMKKFFSLKTALAVTVAVVALGIAAPVAEAASTKTFSFAYIDDHFAAANTSYLYNYFNNPAANAALTTVPAILGTGLFTVNAVPLLSGDFDGDGLTDYVYQVIGATGLRTKSAPSANTTAITGLAPTGTVLHEDNVTTNDNQLAVFGDGTGGLSFEGIAVILDNLSFSPDLLYATAGEIIAGVTTFIEYPSPTGTIRDISLALKEVPEPGTLALLGIGLAGLGLIRRRRNAQ